MAYRVAEEKQGHAMRTRPCYHWGHALVVIEDETHFFWKSNLSQQS